VRGRLWFEAVMLSANEASQGISQRLKLRPILNIRRPVVKRNLVKKSDQRLRYFARARADVAVGSRGTEGTP